MSERIGIDHSEFDVLSPHTSQALSTCFAKIIEMGSTTGDYLEFGVYQGYSLLHAYLETCRLGLEHMHLFGFDSFSGMPTPTHIDVDGVTVSGMYACEKAEVLRKLLKHGVDLSRVTLVEGFYEETLNEETRNKLGIKEAAIILVDCVFYTSTKLVLSFVRTIIRDKTIILFGDWNRFNSNPNRGQRRAFTEFLENNPQFIAEPFISLGGHVQSFILRNQ